MSKWRFILTDMLGAVKGEVTNATERKLVLPHMRVPTATFTMPLWHDRANDVLNSDCLLKVYRQRSSGTRDLVFHGPVISAEEAGEGQQQTIAVTATGPFWRLAKRLIPASKIKATGVTYGTPAVPIDLGTIAHTVLADVNATHFTGIAVGSHSATTTGWAGPWFLKNAAEAITELHAGLASFEYVVTPTEATAYAQSNPQGWPRIGLLDIASVIGATKADAVFEYGTTKANVVSYKRSVTRDGILNQAVVSVNGWPDGTTRDLRTRTDATSVNARGLFEEVVPDAQVEDDALRDKLGDFHLTYRKNPRQLITFKPRSDATPEPFVDYIVGDTVRARALVRDSVRFDALMRVWGVTFTIDAQGSEDVELELTPAS
jgi:hypothetical protein